MTGPRVGYQEFAEMAPDARKALTALGAAVDATGLDKGLTEIVKLRASQINGCAFCIAFHLNMARKHGVDARKLDLVAAWREAGVYSQRELAALAWTEALTLAPGTGGTDDLYADLLAQFSREEALALTIAVGTINQWNRIAAALRFAPPAAG
ncbi:MAG TPA: carboxymuconolactone decarboxylase family protein [Rhodoblastus sp.]|nr:carboxymuconolactone decarboxylase family protein [Rhodoblastus sp.]